MSTSDDESVRSSEVTSSSSATSPSTTPGQTVTKIDDSIAATNESRTDDVLSTDFLDEDSLTTSSSSATSSSKITPGQTETETAGGVSMSELWKAIQPLTDLAEEFSENSITKSMKSALQGEDDDGDIVRPLTFRKWPNPTGGVLAGTQSSMGLPGGRISDVLDAETENDGDMIKEAWERLENAIVRFNGLPVGTLAALDPNADALNYNQVIVRDFVPTGLAYLMKKEPEPEIVKNFILNTLDIQGWKKRIDEFTLGEGVMPASFKVLKDIDGVTEKLVADFGGSAIGRVAPVDAGFWWIILLRAYWKCTGDRTLICLEKVQEGMKRILQHCLSNGFDTYPTLLCADGCSMIDRRMGIYGYPIEIQALFHFAMRCALEMILVSDTESKELIERINQRVSALSFHIQKYYWLDFSQLNSIYRYKTEEYSQTAVNKFNVIPDSIPDWVFDFMTMRGGYLIGNVSPARMDFRWFVAGNCIAILSSLATAQQKSAIMDLIEDHFEDLIGEMPLKVTYPALEGHDWRILTGSDPKNTRWSYHNGGSWPVLLWLFTAACIKVGRPHLAKKAIEKAEQRLGKDGWAEYYDGKTGRLVGKQARKYQTWSIAGYLVAKMLMENPAHLSLISLLQDDNKNKDIAAAAAAAAPPNRARSCSAAFPTKESI